MSFTEYDDMTGVFVAKLILEELRLIRSEIKKEIQKLGFDMKISVMRRNNAEESEIIEENCKEVVQTVSDSNQPVNDFFASSLVLGDGFAVEGKERNDYDLNKSEKVAPYTAVKLDTVNRVLDTDDIILDNGVDATACKRKGDDCVNDAICDLTEEKSEQTSFVSSCTTLEPNCSLPSKFSSDLSCVIKYDPYDNAHSYVQNADETSTKVGFIHLEDGKISENNGKNDGTIKDRPKTRSTTNTRFEPKKKEERTPENANISNDLKIPITHLQVYTCQFCTKNFKCYRNFANHLQTHTGERPYKCDASSKEETQSYHYRTHKGERPFKCDVCSKAFKNSSHLNVHYRIHTGEKPFKCSICLKEFAVKSNLNVHSRIHTGEKPYQCDVCLKRFCQKNDMKKHRRTHTGEKPYKCDRCPKRFKKFALLKAHYRIHTGENHLNMRFVQNDSKMF